MCFLTARLALERPRGSGGIKHNRQENLCVLEIKRLTRRAEKKLMTWENIDIETLLRWAFRDQKIHAVMEGDGGLLPAEAALDGFTGGTVSRDGCHAALRRSELGTRVDEFAPGLGRAHADAEAVYVLLRELSPSDGRPSATAGLIYQNALIGARPDWMAGARTKVVKVLNRRQKPKMIYDRNRRAVACRISYENPRQMIEYCRRRYEIWHGGLRAMAAVFRDEPDRLRQYKVTGPDAPARPWNQSKVEKHEKTS